VNILRRTLIDDAGNVLRRAWSVRWVAGSVVFSIAEAVVPFFYDAWPPRVAASIAGVMAAIGFAARFMKQPRMHDGDTAP